MDRTLITDHFLGPTLMQVCAESDVTDQEILTVCNTKNPSGTTTGWVTVIRTLETGLDNQLPTPCQDHPGRTHFLIHC